jgi:putative transcriptional regulator
MRADGTNIEVMSDGSERPFPDTPMRTMTEAEIEAAAADPDARPMTPEELKKARRVPRVKTLRRALGLTQQEFAGRYRIPLGTLRDWEQGRTEPDQPARAYLTVIAHDPEGVRRAFQWAGPQAGRRISPRSNRSPNAGMAREMARGGQNAPRVL